MTTTAATTVVGHLDLDEQRCLVADVLELVGDEPWIVPVAGANEMSVRIFNLGPLGWLATARHGYHYSNRHPLTGRLWPSIPQRLLDVLVPFGWPDGVPDDEPPIDCVHLVRYPPGATLGFHVDQTERNKRGRVLTGSFGDRAKWDLVDDDGVRTSTVLNSGDITLLAGPTRSLQHRIAKVLTSATTDLFNPSPLPWPGRLAVSIRSGAGVRP